MIFLVVFPYNLYKFKTVTLRTIPIKTICIVRNTKKLQKSLWKSWSKYNKDISHNVFHWGQRKYKAPEANNYKQIPSLYYNMQQCR